jgi:hypothetical protein
MNGRIKLLRIGTGNDFSKTALTKVNIPVLAQHRAPAVPTATVVYPGLFRNWRRAQRRSCNSTVILSSYSCLSVSAGSIRAIRSVGAVTATRVTNPNTAIADTIVGAS